MTSPGQIPTPASDEEDEEPGYGGRKAARRGAGIPRAAAKPAASPTRPRRGSGGAVEDWRGEKVQERVRA